MATTTTQKLIPPTVRKSSHSTVDAKALSRQGAMALGTVLAGAGVAVAGTVLALPELAAVGMIAGAVGVGLKYKDTIRQRDDLQITKDSH